MQIIYNKQTLAVEPGITLQQWLAASSTVPTGPYAIAVNKTFVPRDTYATLVLSDNDEIEIVEPMQGG